MLQFQLKISILTHYLAPFGYTITLILCPFSSVNVNTAAICSCISFKVRPLTPSLFLHDTEYARTGTFNKFYKTSVILFSFLFLYLNLPFLFDTREGQLYVNNSYDKRQELLQPLLPCSDLTQSLRSILIQRV